MCYIACFDLSTSSCLLNPGPRTARLYAALASVKNKRKQNFSALAFQPYIPSFRSPGSNYPSTSRSEPQRRHDSSFF